MARIRIGERDEEIVRPLVLCVRVFSLRQIANHWFLGEISNARRRMNQLAMEKLVQRVPVLARPLPPLDSPGITWRLGDDEPDFGSAAFRFRNRWRNRPLRSCAAYIATPRATQIYGGPTRGQLQHGLQITHDLGVSQVWLHFDEHRPAWADAWKGEDIMAHTRRGEKLPDAFIVDKNQRTVSVVEFGGAYDQRRLRDFHEDCKKRDLNYQVW